MERLWAAVLEESLRHATVMLWARNGGATESHVIRSRARLLGAVERYAAAMDGASS